MPVEFLISALVTLLVVVDPLGLVPTFLAITHGLPDRARRNVALRACLIAAAILAGSALIGDWLLRTLSISLPAFRIAGGLLLFSIASEMVFGVRIERQSREAEEAIEEHVRNIAAFPLAIPLMAGPGAITATVLLAGRAGGDPLRLAMLLGVVAVVLALCFVVFTARGAHRDAARHHRQCRAVAPARRAAGRARRAIRDRRRARRAGGVGKLPSWPGIIARPSTPCCNQTRKAWMPGTGPGMTVDRIERLAKRQNGISSSMSADLPAPASAGLRSRAGLGPLEPKSSPLSALAPPPPRVSSMVSCELKPCSTTSVE